MIQSGFCPGQPMQCLSIGVELAKEKYIAADGNQQSKFGFKIGGGIDQDPAACPFMYPDSGIYVTFVEPNSSAEKAGLRRHDKILEVNGVDFTMATHKQAVKCIQKYDIIKILIARREMVL